MTKNLSIFLLAAALGLLAGCMTSPLSSSGSSTTRSGIRSATPSASNSSASGPDSTSAAIPSGAITPPDVQDSSNGNFGTNQNPADGAGLRELERGQASWYGPRFHGRRTASGERYDQHALTAAHRTLPFGTLVRVRSLVTGKEVDVRVTDRGPFVRGRIIDVSRAAAEALGMMGLGVKLVSLHIIESATPVANFYRAAKAR